MKTQNWTGIMVLGGMSVSFWIGCNSQAGQLETVDKIPVKTKAVVQEEISLPIHTSGKLASTAETKLSFKVGGIVDEIFVDEGATVIKGKLLARLKLTEIQARVRQARSGFEKAMRDLKRVKQLYADSVATLEQKQDAATALEIARSNLDIAQFNLNHSEIRAPENGKILKRFVESNELVAPGYPVFLFGAGGKSWIVRGGVTDKDIIRLQLGDSASVAFDAYPEIYFPAFISEIAETSDPMNGTYEVELNIHQNEHKLISGFVAKIDIFPAKKRLFSMVPIEALVEADGHTGYVYALHASEDSVQKIPIHIGHILDDKIAVPFGLEKVTKVVTEGAAYLTHGAKVRLSSSAAKPQMTNNKNQNDK